MAKTDHLTNEELIEKTINEGSIEILEFEPIPGTTVARITKAIYTLQLVEETQTVKVENRIEYVNPANSNSTRAIKRSIKTII